MTDKQELLGRLKALIQDYQNLSPQYRKEASERKAEEFVLELFDILGWKKRSEEVMPQKRITRAGSSERVDYAFRMAGALSPSLYVEVKRFSKSLEDPDAVEQAIDYGKNGGARWAVLTNFHQIRIFNSNYYDRPEDAELFATIDLTGNLDDALVIEQLMLLSREACAEGKLDHYAKLHKKWKESADVEELLTITLLGIRKKLSKAIVEHNMPLIEGKKNREQFIDECVQLLLDRLIFCRIVEDNGIDEDHKLSHEYERWEKDKRAQFYGECINPFFAKMKKVYDSTIFDAHTIDSFRIKNDEFVEAFEAFYHTKDGLRYRFDAIPTDVLGHVYENYLSYKAKKTATSGIEEELFKRKRSGIYYTPEFLVDDLVKRTIGKRLAKCKKPSDALSIKVLDPACGSGTFLIRAYDEFRKWYLEHPEASQTTLDGDGHGIQSFLDSVMERCLYGIDLDPRAVELTRLNLFIRSIHNPNRLPDLHIVCANTLVSDPEYDDAPPFIFERIFPLVKEEGGFDVVITNPPWEKWKPDSQEFFEPHDPGFKSLTAQKAKARMHELFSKRPYLKRQWVLYNENYELMSRYFRDENNYRFQSDEAEGRQVSGDLDLYKLFTEKVFQLLKPGGLAGLVVPSGIYTDLGAKGLRRMMFENCEVEGIYSFENRKFIFPDIDQRYKFVLLSFKKGGKTKEFPAAFFLYSKEDLEKAHKEPTLLSVDFVKSSSPTSWNVLEIKTPQDYSIVRKMLEHPHLGDELKDSWNIQLSRGFDMTNDSHLFRPYGEGVPMLEGKNIHQFTHRWKEAPQARYSIKESDIAANLKEDKVYHNGYWLAYRLIARSTDNRTLISAIIPPGYVCGNSIAIIRMGGMEEMCYLSAVLNSFVLDYLIRQKVSANVNMFYFKELPIPRLQNGPLFDSIVRKAAMLTCTTTEYDELKKAVGIEAGVTDETDRETVRAQLDAIIAKNVYGITRDELANILTLFPIVEEKTKQMVLGEYDKLD